MSTLDANAKKLVATSGANFLYPAVTEDELDNEQLLVGNYRRALGSKRLAWAITGVLVFGAIYSYVKEG